MTTRKAATVSKPKAPKPKAPARKVSQVNSDAWGVTYSREGSGHTLHLPYGLSPAEVSKAFDEAFGKGE